MARFEIEANGKRYEVDAPSKEAFIAALGGPEQKVSGPDFGVAEMAPEDPRLKQAYERANPQSLSMGDVGGQALANLGPSAKQFGSDMLGIVTDPIGTATNLYNVGSGAVQKLIPGEQGNEKYADAVGGYFADRYGGWDNIKRTMAKDPVGFLADASTVMTGGAALPARAPGALGTVSRVTGAVGRAVDPLSAITKGAKLAGTGAGKVATTALGLTTGTGGDAIGRAAKAGFQGGQAGQTFRDNMRGRVPMEDVVAQAKSAVQTIKTQRQNAYKAGMADLSNDRTVIDFRRIDAAINNASPIAKFTGPRSGITVSLEPSVTKTAGDIASVLDEWRRLPPDDFHTPEGLDALKQRIGDIREGVEKGSRSEALATQVYNIVKNQIVQQAPEYAKTMERYQKASELIREIEGTLSLGRNARIDTSLRKLQSVLRNNVNTNYGERLNLVTLLQDAGAPHLLEALAGQAMSTMEPRGLARIVAAVGSTGTAGLAILGGLNPATAAALLGQLAASSPRLVGEAAHLAGRAAKAGTNVGKAKPVLQAGYETRAAGERHQPLEITVPIGGRF